MLFSVPYVKGILGVLTDLGIARSVDNVYFSDGKYASARAGMLLDDESMAELQQIRSTLGIRLNYLLNGSYVPNELYAHTGELIDHIKTLNPDIVTVSNTYLLKLRSLHSLGIELHNSVNNRVSDVQAVHFYSTNFGLKHILLDRSLLRDRQGLRDISKYCETNGISTTLLVNEGCIYNCPWKPYDDLIISQSDSSNVEIRGITKYVQDNLGCHLFFTKNPHEILHTAFCLPSTASSLFEYVNVLKIAGRGTDKEVIRRRLIAYINGDDSILLTDMLETPVPVELRKVTCAELSNNKFSSATENCKFRCFACKKCKDIYEKVHERK